MMLERGKLSCEWAVASRIQLVSIERNALKSPFDGGGEEEEEINTVQVALAA